MQHLQSDEQVQAWLGILRARRWVADSQITPKHLVGRDSATRYVACYVTGSAISNSRIRADDGRNVTIDVWDYRTDRWTTETMPGEEFVRRFMLHIIPPYVHRVRYAGCFQSGKRKSRLEGMRAAILEQNRQQGIASPRAEHKAKLLAIGIEQTDEDKAQRLQRTPACLTCGKPGMQSGQHRNALETCRYLNALRALIAFFAWSAATSDHWNSFEWKRFLARINSPKASFWDWSLRLRFEQSYCELNRPETRGWRLEEFRWLPRIILKTSSSLRVFASPRELWLFESPRKADFQPASAEGPRTRRKNRLRIRKTLASIARKRHDFGASRCSKRSLESCAEQNHLRENIGESCEIEKSRALRF